MKCSLPNGRALHLRSPCLDLILCVYTYTVFNYSINVSSCKLIQNLEFIGFEKSAI